MGKNYTTIEKHAKHETDLLQIAKSISWQFFPKQPLLILFSL